MIKLSLLFLWAFFPMISSFIVLFAFWWPRENIPWARIAAMSFTCGVLMMMYAMCAQEMFNKIQALPA
jgi:hypothetical protein